jgi:hypothetical protein
MKRTALTWFVQQSVVSGRKRTCYLFNVMHGNLKTTDGTAVELGVDVVFSLVNFGQAFAIAEVQRRTPKLSGMFHPFSSVPQTMR